MVHSDTCSLKASLLKALHGFGLCLSYITILIRFQIENIKLGYIPDVVPHYENLITP